jgi:hypothetical protein
MDGREGRFLNSSGEAIAIEVAGDRTKPIGAKIAALERNTTRPVITTNVGIHVFVYAGRNRHGCRDSSA